MLILDFYSGAGGWAHGLLAAGHRVIGYDILDFSKVYPGEFVQADLLQNIDFPQADFITASPPCTEFARTSFPPTWAAARKPADIQGACQLFERVFELVDIIKPTHGFIIENVRGAQKFCGLAKEHMGSRYLWGSYPAFQPYQPRKGELYGKVRVPQYVRNLIPKSSVPADISYPAVLRSFIPYPISYGLGLKLKEIETQKV